MGYIKFNRIVVCRWREHSLYKFLASLSLTLLLNLLFISQFIMATNWARTFTLNGGSRPICLVTETSCGCVWKQFSRRIPSTWEYSVPTCFDLTLTLSAELKTHLSDTWNIKCRIVDQTNGYQRNKGPYICLAITWAWHRCSSWDGFWFLYINYNSIGCQKSFGNRSCMLQATSDYLPQISVEN